MTTPTATTTQAAAQPAETANQKFDNFIQRIEAVATAMRERGVGELYLKALSEILFRGSGGEKQMLSVAMLIITAYETGLEAGSKK